MDAVRFEAVGVELGSRAVLRGVSLRVGAGEIVGISGPNGAGKSTLLRVAGALVAPSRGRVSIGGCDPLVAARSGFTGWCSGDAGWPRRLTLRAALAHHGGLRGIGRRDLAAEIERWAERLGFVDHLDAPAALCSTGLRQRAALGRALLGGPRVALLDEPLRGVDAASAPGLADAVRRHLDGAAAIWVSHDAGELERVADRRLELEAGRLRGARLVCAA